MRSGVIVVFVMLVMGVSSDIIKLYFSGFGFCIFKLYSFEVVNYNIKKFCFEFLDLN